MRICSSELTPLENIIHEITVPNTNFEDTQDCYDLKETIWIFLDDYLKDHIEIYKDKHFDEIVRQNYHRCYPTFLLVGERVGEKENEEGKLKRKRKEEDVQRKRRRQEEDVQRKDVENNYFINFM